MKHQKTILTVLLLIFCNNALLMSSSDDLAFPTKLSDRIWALNEKATASTLSFLTSGRSILSTVACSVALANLFNPEAHRRNKNNPGAVCIESTWHGASTYVGVWLLSTLCFPATNKWRRWAKKIEGSREQENKNRTTALTQAHEKVAALLNEFKQTIEANSATCTAKKEFILGVKTTLGKTLNNDALYRYDFNQTYAPTKPYQIALFEDFTQNFERYIRKFQSPYSYAQEGYKGNFITSAAQSALDLTRTNWELKDNRSSALVRSDPQG